MAFLGTFGAAIISPLLSWRLDATPLMSVRFAFAGFDLFRGSCSNMVCHSFAFGPGPNGSLAILMTDVGTFSKTFSEALEILTANKLRASPQQEHFCSLSFWGYSKVCP